LPSARHGQLKHKNTLLSAELEGLTASVAQARAAVAAASAARPEAGERLAAEAELASAKERNQTLKAELASHSASDQALQKQMVGLQCVPGMRSAVTPPVSDHAALQEHGH
jgi:chromosome segregation ATPase